MSVCCRVETWGEGTDRLVKAGEHVQGREPQAPSMVTGLLWKYQYSQVLIGVRSRLCVLSCFIHNILFQRD